uniref:Uncharacterized protein n=1 Tax=Aegilops tauschii subsp. strangulata TaxID=200361 RepID=A0A453FJV9_AEGTS
MGGGHHTGLSALHPGAGHGRHDPGGAGTHDGRERRRQGEGGADAALRHRHQHAAAVALRDAAAHGHRRLLRLRHPGDGHRAGLVARGHTRRPRGDQSIIHSLLLSSICTFRSSLTVGSNQNHLSAEVPPEHEGHTGGTHSVLQHSDHPWLQPALGYFLQVTTHCQVVVLVVTCCVLHLHITSVLLTDGLVMGVTFRFFSPLGMAPVVALLGFGLFERGFPVVGRCVEVGLPMLILFVVLS